MTITWVDSTSGSRDKGHGPNLCRTEPKPFKRKGDIQWHHVPTDNNPSDQGSRGIEPRKMGNLWFEGSKWLSSPDKWLQQPEVVEISETARKSVKPKLEKQLFAKEEEQNETTDPLLHKYASYWK